MEHVFLFRIRTRSGQEMVLVFAHGNPTKEDVLAVLKDGDDDAREVVEDAKDWPKIRFGDQLLSQVARMSISRERVHGI